MRLMIDAHLDLGWCAVSFDRDLTLCVEEIRRREAGMNDTHGRGNNTLSLPELRRAGVAIAVGTLLARSGPAHQRPAGYKRTDLDYAAQPIAYAMAHAQLAYYRLLERQGHVRFILNRREFDAHWDAYRAAPQMTPLGVILSMEGADPIVDVEQVPYWWEQGLRAVGPAHYGRSHYAYGTGVDGPLSEAGVELLKQFEKIGIILDVTHLSDISFWQAMEMYHGPMLASHHNCRSLVPGDRQLADEQIKTLIARDAVIGLALDAWMLYPNWIRGETKPEVVGLAAAADHIDHVCQLAGNVRHSAIGSDLDGGFGCEQTPRDLNTITDLQKLGDILSSRGYSDADIDAIFHNNWVRFFRRALPEEK
jgi:membrane dipeptidase